jgi:vacuolar-type H+-ATPase subunit B/Vma2
MTRSQLSRILEEFTVCVIHTTMSDMETDEQYDLISTGIDAIVDAVILVNERKIPVPSDN